MSLIRQIWLLLVAVLLLALAGAVGINLLSTRDTLQTQLRLKNSDNAQSAGAGAVAAARRRAADGAADGGAVRHRLLPPHPLRRRRRQRGLRARGRGGRAAARRPGSSRLSPIEPVPGVAQVSDGWRALGPVEVRQPRGLRARRAVARQRARAALLAALGAVAGCWPRPACGASAGRWTPRWRRRRRWWTAGSSLVASRACPNCSASRGR